MATADQRIAYLEGRVEEHTRQIEGIREALVSLEARIDRRFDAMDGRLDRLEQRFDDKLSRQFLWLVGLQLTTLASMLAALSTLAIR